MGVIVPTAVGANDHSMGPLLVPARNTTVSPLKAVLFPETLSRCSFKGILRKIQPRPPRGDVGRRRPDSDRELSCKDEGSLRPESQPPASSASNDMLAGRRLLIAKSLQIPHELAPTVGEELTLVFHCRHAWA